MFDAYIKAFMVLFVVVDPVSMAPIFMVMTHGATVAYRRRMAIKGVLVAGGILFFFLLVGDTLLKVLGVSLGAFRIAGGLLMFLVALDMVFPKNFHMREPSKDERKEAEEREDISVFPLAFPLLAGPGALTTLMLMLPAQDQGDPLHYVFVGAVILGVLLITLISLLVSGKITAFMGETGANLLSRLLGLVLAALSVQFVLDGIRTTLGA
ncbi:MarC family protein [Acidihalobacter ferrooxydans]|uniref:UPF0056 membrane protein n=1 Tax=Acidihalobacter ferrooxydans TaxID=1765967 RepID=A0A1P8UHY8_9GAMM|nr:MarC family protein [Acidihalobacter ferrooxydans]APZ43463.1 MarC family transcriptional regulator [Acidihalobacter ferrooxydans]